MFRHIFNYLPLLFYTLIRNCEVNEESKYEEFTKNRKNLTSSKLIQCIDFCFDSVKELFIYAICSGLC